MPEEIRKVYFTIGEVAQMFDVNPSLLRYWEKEFEMIKPFKNKKGDRYFSEKDIEIIRTIHYLTKQKGYTLQGAKEVIKNSATKAQIRAKVVDTLTQMKFFLNEIKEEL